LLGNAFQSQAQLRSAAESRLLAENRQIAVLISDSLTEEKNFALSLAESHEIGTFLINKALGMSLHYGLNANLDAIEQSFRRKLAQKTVMGAQAYERILYYDESGAAVADSATRSPPMALPSSGEGDVKLIIDSVHGWIIAAAPVDYRGTPGGTVVTVAPVSLLSRYLPDSSTNQGLDRVILSESGRALDASDDSPLQGGPWPALAQLPPATTVPLSDIPGVAFNPAFKGYDLVVRVPIAGSSLSLVALVSNSLLYGRITSRVFLYFISAVPLILLLAAVWLERMRSRTQRLEADVRESNRNRVELQGRNDDLTIEIARRHALELALRKSEERYRTYIEHAPEGIFVADDAGRFVDVNPSACNMVGYSRDELLNMDVMGLSPWGQTSEHTALLERVKRAGREDVELGIRKKDGTEIVTSLRAIALPDRTVMGFCVDITERKEAEGRIYQLAYFDPLTALPNRRLLMDRLRQAAAGRGRDYGAVLMLDLDHFKDLNDTQGHDVGDRLITEVARRLTESARQEDTVSRLGGDEYVIVAEGLGAEESAAAVRAEIIAEKIHKAVSRPYALVSGRTAYQTSCSIGVTLFRGGKLSVEVLLKQADVALYQAKNAGRNAIRFFSPEMQAAIDARMKMEASLRRAIRRSELKLYYQPQVDRDRRIYGAEALLRWIPANADPVPPACFIPLAEGTKLIVPIGDWVLEQACAQLKRWQADVRTAALTLSINVSGRQFHQPDFVERVSAQIARFGIEPSRLKLELTESVLLERIDEVIARMRRLKELGVGFSLDDFGTGYSSLSYLKRLPLDEVKVDQSFVRDITRDQNDAAIVRAVLAMSQSLGLTVIAEGVETEAQRVFLSTYGCEHYQGYLFGKPAPIESIPGLNGKQDEKGDGATPYIAVRARDRRRSCSRSTNVHDITSGAEVTNQGEQIL